MSTTSTTPTTPSHPTPAASAGPALPPGSTRPQREIKLVSHSTIFYWWPIWLFGFIFGFITLGENHRLAVLPADAHVEVTSRDEATHRPNGYRITTGHATRSLDRAVGIKPGDTLSESWQPPPAEKTGFVTKVSQKAWMGPVYCVILLMTILITNVPLRGLWSFLVILILIVVSLGITLIPNGWDDLLATLGGLHIFINMAGYFFIAITVLILWAVSVFIFDQRTYMIVEPGQIRVCEHIGASVRNIDATGLEFEKQRDDLFRHWILGFFSGDLIIHLPDKREQIRLPNVLWIGWRLEEVQRILREKATVISG